jgi:hypothetical protein
MKILRTLLILIMTLCSLGSFAQVTPHLTMTKLLDISIGFPKMKQNNVIDDLTKNFDFNRCDNTRHGMKHGWMYTLGRTLTLARA